MLYGPDEEILKEEAEKFNSYLKLFKHFYADDLEEEEFDEDIDTSDMDIPDEETLMRLIDSLENVMNK